jgi:hypothetical protein
MMRIVIETLVLRPNDWRSWRELRLAALAEGLLPLSAPLWPSGAVLETPSNGGAVASRASH